MHARKRNGFIKIRRNVKEDIGNNYRNIAECGKKVWVTNANSIGIEYVGYYDEVPGQREVIYHDELLANRREECIIL